jgi:2-polyprenyl-3-methyl-5-hydroxy-6-metoxy-1,4-benzoquinol methylase/Zn ribbon nucleic-acid-binding protein
MNMSKDNFITRACCPACKSTRSETIYSCEFSSSPVRDYIEAFYAPQGGVELKYLEGGRFTLRECGACGVIYQEEIPNEFLSKKLYEEWLDPEIALNQYVDSKDLNYYSGYAQEIMMLIAYFKAIPSRLKFFDFAMGWGGWAMMAMAFGGEPYGLELSRSMQEHARSHGIKVIFWDEIPDYRFDVINAEEVLEHIAEPLETLSHLKNSLKPEGIIKISVPDGHDVKRRLSISDWTAPKFSKNSLNPVSPLEHINCFNRASLIKMADLAGLEIINMPLSLQYAYATNWPLIKPALKNILYPLYRSVLRRGTHIFLRQKQS